MTSPNPSASASASGPQSTSVASGITPEGQAWQAVWTAHSAAVFGYPLVGVHLESGDEIDKARAQEQLHADRRDAAAAELTRRNVPLPSAPALALPATDVTTSGAARAFAVQLEEQVARAYRSLLVGVVPAGRNAALTDLTTAALDATWWRARATPNTPTVPFAGT